MEQDLFVTSSTGEELAVHIRKPDSNGKFPAIIFVQGIGMDMHEYNNSHDDITTALVEGGFTTIQFNFSYQRLVTKSIDREIGLSNRAKEVEDVIGWALRTRVANTQRLGIYAMSFGVSTALMTNMATISSLCLTCGLGFRPQRYMQRYLNRGDVINREGETRLTRSSGKTMIVGPEFWPSLETLHQEDLVKHLTIPTLVIHGNQDAYVETEDMLSVYRSIPDGKKQLKRFDGVGHGFSEVSPQIRNTFLKLVCDWFTQTL